MQAQKISVKAFLVKASYLLVIGFVSGAIIGTQQIVQPDSQVFSSLNNAVVIPIVLAAAFVAFWLARSLYPRFWFLFPVTYLIAQYLSVGTTYWLAEYGVSAQLAAGMLFSSIFLLILVVVTSILAITRNWHLSMGAVVFAVVLGILSVTVLVRSQQSLVQLRHERFAIYAPRMDGTEIKETCVTGCTSFGATTYAYNVMQSRPPHHDTGVSFRQLSLDDIRNPASVCRHVEEYGKSKLTYTASIKVANVQLWHATETRDRGVNGQKLEQPATDDYYCFAKGLYRYEIKRGHATGSLLEFYQVYPIERIVESLEPLRLEQAVRQIRD